MILRWNADHSLARTESLNYPEFQWEFNDAAAGKFREMLSGLIEAIEQRP